jgi:uncharacterized protein (DUF4415 family)
MSNAKPIVFARLSDGTILQRRRDGSFRAVKDKTDYARLAKLSEDEIERMAQSDPDHPGLDAEFWRRLDEVETPQSKEAISIKLDKDVLAFFRKQGRGYQTRINTVLRRYMQARRKAG